MLNTSLAAEKDLSSLQIEPMGDEVDDLKHRKHLANINFCMFWISMIVLATLIFDNIWLTSSTKTPIPSRCVDTGCEFPINMPNPGGRNHIYIEFDNLNQNFKDYVNSYSARVFRDDISPTTSDTKTCKPLQTNGEMNKTKSYTGVDLNPTLTAVPCGAIAYTYPDSKECLILQLTTV